jgi:isocitrate dehydrogenase
LKLITRPGCEKIVRYAFEYARLNNRRKVTCFTKDNIMKMTDGLFHKVFDEIAQEYPSIENEHWIVDIGAAKLADTPEDFDVVVMPNLYGDILSDVAAQITGSVGLGGSANIGEHVAMFEAIHGSAPAIANQNLANPSGLLHGAIMMLVHIGQTDAAGRVHNAWLKTIEDGSHTKDIFKEGTSRQMVGTREFAEAVIERLGQTPQTLKKISYAQTGEMISTKYNPMIDETAIRKEKVGVDVFLEWNGGSSDDLGAIIEGANGDDLKLVMITNRGVKVFPNGMPETFCTDHWRCRFMAAEKEAAVTNAQILNLLIRVDRIGLDIIKTETLCTFDGEAGYSLGQGQ